MKHKAIRALIVGAFVTTAGAQEFSEYIHPASNPAHDLTGKEFLKDLGGNFTGLITKKDLLPLAGWAAAYAAATVPEQRIEQHFAPGGVWGNWSAPGKYIGNPAILGSASVGLFLVSRKSDDRRFRSFSYSLVQGMITSAGVGFSGKVAFQRLRPNGQNNLSFPSGHASDSFMFATVAAEHYGWKVGIPAYAVASYVAATRLADRKHHLTDVVGGAAIGYLIGKAVSRRMKPGEEPRFSFSVMPMRGGFGASIQVALSRK